MFAGTLLMFAGTLATLGGTLLKTLPATSENASRSGDIADTE
jgi:hypothetical protein